MISLYVVVYLLSCVIFFYFLTKNRKKVWGYLNKEDIFWLLFSSAIYPLVIVGYIIHQLFNWLERVVND